MATDIATLSLKLDASQLKSGAREAEGSLASMSGMATKLTAGLAGLGITFGLTAGIKKFVTETSIAEDAVAQLEARLKSTGYAAGQTSAGLQEMAASLQRVTTFSDEAVMSAQTMLLTFDKIKGSTFPAATQATLDLATAMGGDLQGAAIQLGKALQDPEAGLTALKRSGVSFSEEQQKLIKLLFATGKEAEAQAMILKELQKEFGGAADAARHTLGGALKQLKNDFGDLFEMQGSGGLQTMLGWLDTAIVKLNTVLNLRARIMGAKFGSSSDDSGGGAVGFVGPPAPVISATTLAQLEYTKAMQDATKALIDKAQAATIDLAVGTAHYELLVKTAVAQQKLADIQKKADDEAYTRNTKSITLGGGPKVGEIKERSPLATVFGVSKDDLATIGTLITQANQKVEALEHQSFVARHEAWVAFEADIAKVRENFQRQWQQTVSNGIASMLTNGLDSWRDFFKAIGDMAAHSIGDIISRQVAKLSDAMKGAISSGAFGASTGYSSANPLMGAAGGAAAGFLTAGPVGAVVGGIAGLVGGLFGQAAAAKKAREEAERLAAAQLAQAKAAEAAAAAAQALLEYEQALATSDLRVRQLRSAGMTAEADALDLFNRQATEFADAVKRGFSPEFLAALGQMQAVERQTAAIQAAISAQQALADAEKAAGEQAQQAAQAMADNQKQAADAARAFGYSVEELAVRLLNATGHTGEASRKALLLQQQRERDDVNAKLQADFYAISAYSYLVAYMNVGRGTGPTSAQITANDLANLEIPRLTDYLAQLLDVQQAELSQFDAGAKGTSMAGASAAVPGTAGSFNTIVSRTTAVQGDRMVDELTTARILLTAIEVNTRPLRAGLGALVNGALGPVFQGSQALSGASGVS